jgi:hypothetical protein
MLAPPDPEMRRAALEQGDPTKEKDFNTQDSKPAAISLQAHKLRRLYFFAHGAARVIARLAFGVCR